MEKVFPGEIHCAFEGGLEAGVGDDEFEALGTVGQRNTAYVETRVVVRTAQRGGLDEAVGLVACFENAHPEALVQVRIQTRCTVPAAAIGKVGFEMIDFAKHDASIIAQRVRQSINQKIP